MGRYGGEEYCVALFGRSPEQSAQLAEKIRQEVITKSVGWLNNADTITASIGIANLRDGGCTVKEIVNWADHALYEAKETGRNKVVIWDPVNNRSHQNISEAEGVTALFSKQHMVEAQQHADETMANASPDELIRLANSHPTTGIDPLTKLPSRLIFMDRITQAIGRADRENQRVAVLHISLDSFERFRGLFGEASSQDLIAAVSARFSTALRGANTVSLFDGGNRLPTLSRISDDKFLVEISDLNEINTITSIIKRLFESLDEPIHVEQEKIYVTANIGVSLYPDDGEDTETLLKYASLAEQHARKEDGPNGYRFFAEAMNKTSRRQLTLEAGIREAMERDEFSLHYQPIMDARTGRVETIETLLRCENSLFHGMPIGMVISIAEQTGLIIEIGEWVMRKAIGQAETWLASGIEVPRLSVNLSAIQLSNSAAMERLYRIIMEMSLPPRKFQLEITETAILNDVETAGTSLMRLQQAGILIALDDFGTGQSSLGYLRRFRPDVLKIDRCFIGEITTSHADETLVEAILAMSQRMGIRVVVEGVETKKQLDKVRDMGCDEIQGFYISRPLPADQMGKWLTAVKGVNLIEATHQNERLAKVG